MNNIIGLIFAIFVNGILCAPASSINNNYAIVFDAGSSGTRMYIYKYDLIEYHLTNIPSNIEEIVYYKLGDEGIDKLTNENDVEILFNVAFEMAESLIPVEYHSRTFLSLAATAGMRLLDAANPNETNRIFNLIRDFFQNSKFLFIDAEKQVKILSGSDEAIGEWLTINYLLDSFKTNEFRNYGLLRLGGSSTQIAFPSSLNPNEDEKQYFTTFKLNNIIENIYTHSYLCWGSNKAFDFYHTKSIKEANYKKTVSTSCYPLGYTIDIPQNDFKSVCTNGVVLNNNNQYSFTINDNDWSETKLHSFNGLSNNDKCKQDVASIVPKQICNHQNCAFDGVYQPLPGNITFYAAGDYYDVIRNTEKLLKTSVETIEQFEQLTDFICQSTYDELILINKESGSGIKKTVHLVCFQNRYLLELFKVFDIKNFQIVNKINNYKVGWTMGYLMTEISNNSDYLNNYF